MWHTSAYFFQKSDFLWSDALFDIWKNQYLFSLVTCDYQNECFIVLLFMPLLFHFTIKVLKGVIKNVVWSKNCDTSGVIVMMYSSTAVGGELQNADSSFSLRLMG